MKRLITYFIIFFWLAALTVAVKNKEAPLPDKDLELRHEYSNFMEDWEANPASMLAACEYYGIKYPRIVTAQAILESGHFKSKVFKEYNNPFGLYNSKIKAYYKFNHWIESIKAYAEMVEYKYTEGDYYTFLRELPYAEDERYIDKIKAIESNLPP